LPRSSACWRTPRRRLDQCTRSGSRPSTEHGGYRPAPGAERAAERRAHRDVDVDAQAAGDSPAVRRGDRGDVPTHASELLGSLGGPLRRRSWEVRDGSAQISCPRSPPAARLLHPHPESVGPAADRHPQAVHGTGTDTSRLNPDSENAVGRKRDATWSARPAGPPPAPRPPAALSRCRPRPVTGPDTSVSYASYEVSSGARLAVAALQEYWDHRRW
jgi:hypothetical protein